MLYAVSVISSSDARAAVILLTIAGFAAIICAARWIYLENVWYATCRAVGYSRRAPAQLVLNRIRQYQRTALKAIGILDAMAKEKGDGDE